MKKVLVLIAVVAAALSLTAVAWAVVAGNLGGGGNFVGPNGVGRIDMNGGGLVDGVRWHPSTVRKALVT